YLVKQKDVSKIAFTGSTEVGKEIKKSTAGSGKKLTLELGGKSPFIIFEDADLDSAVEGIVDAIWFNQGQVCCAGSRLLLQESISSKVERKILSRMKKLRFGNPLDKTIDMGPLISLEQLNIVKRLVKSGLEGGADIYQCDMPPLLKGYFYPPTLLKNVSPSMEIFQQEIFGPVLSSTTFRTPEEAVALANNSRYGLSASIWSENINLALDISPKLKVGVVWINSTNVFDAAVGFGGYRESGYGREGGKEGMYEYLEINSDTFSIKKDARVPRENISRSRQPISPIDQTRKMFIAGSQKRGDSGHSIEILDTQKQQIATVGRGNRKDIRDAVEAANKKMNWTVLSSHARAQIMFYIAENLSQRRDYFISLLSSTTFCQNPIQEFDTALKRLFSFASWADKFDGAVHQAPIRANTIALNEPVGVIGVICPNLAPLASFVTLIAAALCQGNRLVVIPSENFPLPAVDMYQIFDTSDVPSAAINIVTGKHKELIKTLSEHNAVDGIWNFGDPKYESDIDIASISNLKQIWSINGNNINWINYHSSFNKLLLRKSSQVKNIWIPYGE
ncbi:MAG: aldehyde dehydrogenase family protein, partial [Pseudomonadota bacterium]|nr:aldehyde dehydrogenase family protein [Pseudomonadota bacterium]